MMTGQLYSTLAGLKSRAKRLKKATGITHVQALEQMARKGGFENFAQARSILEQRGDA